MAYNILVVDDSGTVRKILSDGLSRDPQIEVVETALGGWVISCCGCVGARSEDPPSRIDGRIICLVSAGIDVGGRV